MMNDFKMIDFNLFSSAPVGGPVLVRGPHRAPVRQNEAFSLLIHFFEISRSFGSIFGLSFVRFSCTEFRLFGGVLMQGTGATRAGAPRCHQNAELFRSELHTWFWNSVKFCESKSLILFLQTARFGHQPTLPPATTCCGELHQSSSLPTQSLDNHYH